MPSTPRVTCIIMGGGRGTRLHPLTSKRCKPAVPLAGKYRLVDIPISNCLNAGYNRIFILSQFQTASLHRHIQESYKFDSFGGGFVDILSAEQTEAGGDWYQGTADAVRQNLQHFQARENDFFVILSGDQLYRMDIRKLVEQHIATKANLTIAAKPMPSSEVHALGVMRVRDDLTISEFVEKPKDPKVVQSLLLSPSVRSRMVESPPGDYCLASMGIYVFNKKTLFNALEHSHERDFGRDIIPTLLGKASIYAHIFEGYWEDIGTVRSFFEANIRLTDEVPPFNFFIHDKTIYSHARYLPATKINNCRINRAILGDGAIIESCSLTRCVIGIRSNVRNGSELENVIMMGQDYMESPEDRMNNGDMGRPHMGIGNNCVIKDAIIDKNARIGNNCRLSPEGKTQMDKDGYAIGFEKGPVIIRDGVLVVTKDAVIPDGTVI